MALLEALAAFAVAMIIFSTIATSIVEVIHRVLGMRHRHLKRAVRFLFDDIIWDRLGDKLDRQPGESRDGAKKRHCDAFVEALTTNPMSRLAQGDKLRGQGDKAFVAKSIENLTPMSFAERLGRTEVGKAVLAEGEEYIDQLLTDFTRSFDRIGRAATEFVSARARALSIVVGISLALIVNIDASRLIITLIEDPDLRLQIIEQVDEAVIANRKAIDEANKALEQIESGKVDDEQINIIKDAIKSTSEQVSTLQTRGFPIGFDYFPYCPENKKDKTCLRLENAQQKTTAFAAWIRWIAMCVVAGCLIGLGGPFWYQVFMKLSQLTQVARALGFGSKNKTTEAQKADPATALADSTEPTSIRDAFEIAAKVHNHKPTAARRIPLDNAGDPLQPEGGTL